MPPFENFVNSLLPEPFRQQEQNTENTQEPASNNSNPLQPVQSFFAEQGEAFQQEMQSIRERMSNLPVIGNLVSPAPVPEAVTAVNSTLEETVVANLPAAPTISVTENASVPTLPPANAIKLSHEQVTIGYAGEDIKPVQTALGVTADGIIGKQTHDAIIAFQTKHNLKPDGILGPLTLAAMNKEFGEGMLATPVASQPVTQLNPVEVNEPQPPLVTPVVPTQDLGIQVEMV